MAITTWLIDKSAFARMQIGRMKYLADWNTRIERGGLGLRPVTRLEIGYFGPIWHIRP